MRAIRIHRALIRPGSGHGNALIGSIALRMGHERRRLAHGIASSRSPSGLRSVLRIALLSLVGIQDPVSAPVHSDDLALLERARSSDEIPESSTPVPHRQRIDDGEIIVRDVAPVRPIHHRIID